MKMSTYDRTNSDDEDDELHQDDKISSDEEDDHLRQDKQWWKWSLATRQAVMIRSLTTRQAVMMMITYNKPSSDDADQRPCQDVVPVMPVIADTCYAHIEGCEDAYHLYEVT